MPEALPNQLEALWRWNILWRRYFKQILQRCCCHGKKKGRVFVCKRTCLRLLFCITRHAHEHVRSLRSIRPPHSLLQALKWGSNIKRKRAQSKKSFAGSSRALKRLAAARLAGDDDDGSWLSDVRLKETVRYAPDHYILYSSFTLFSLSLFCWDKGALSH